MIRDDGKNRRLEDYGLASFDAVRKILPDRSKLNAYCQKGVVRSDPIPVRFPLSMLDRIEDIRKSYRMRTRSDTIRELVQVAIVLLLDVREKIKDPQVVEILRKFHNDARIVDAVQAIPYETLEVVKIVIDNELEIQRRR